MTAFAQDAENVVMRESLWLDEVADMAFDSLDTGGVRPNQKVNLRAKKLHFRAVAEDTDTAIEKIMRERGTTGDLRFQIYSAMKHGHSKIPELDAIVRGVKDYRGTSEARVYKEAPYLGHQDDHTISLNPGSKL